MLVTGEAAAELQRGGGLRALAPGVERRTHDLGAAAVVQGRDAAQMVCLNGVRRVGARAAVIAHYTGQAVWRVAVCSIVVAHVRYLCTETVDVISTVSAANIIITY